MRCFWISDFSFIFYFENFPVFFQKSHVREYTGWLSWQLAYHISLWISLAIFPSCLATPAATIWCPNFGHLMHHSGAVIYCSTRKYYILFLFGGVISGLTTLRYMWQLIYYPFSLTEILWQSLTIGFLRHEGQSQLFNSIDSFRSTLSCMRKGFIFYIKKGLDLYYIFCMFHFSYLNQRIGFFQLSNSFSIMPTGY